MKTDVAVVADCKESLPALTALLNKNKHTEWRNSFRELDEKERKKVIEPAIHPKEGPLLMGEVVNAVAEKAPKGTVLVTDVGQNQLFATRYDRISSLPPVTSNILRSVVSVPVVVWVRWAMVCLPPSAQHLPLTVWWSVSWVTVVSR